MIEKLEDIKHRFEEVGQLIVQPDIISDIKQYTKLNKEYKDLKKVVDKYKEYQQVLGNIQNAKEVLAEERIRNSERWPKGNWKSFSQKKRPWKGN